MSVLVLASAKSSPGVTTACVALAGVWPKERAVRIVEADPDGGTLAARHGLAAEPGLSTLAVASRRSVAGDEIARHSQPLPGGEVSVLVAPPTAEQVGRSLGILADRLPNSLRMDDSDTLVDVGRIRPVTPAWSLVEAADAVLVVARPRVEELQQLPARLRGLRATAARVGLLLVGNQPYPPAEVAAALDVEVVGVLADDPRGAAALNGEGPGRLARSPLLRSARDVADLLVAWSTPPVAARPAPDATAEMPERPAEVRP